MHLEEKVKLAIRDVRDYPKPGIVFKDITPILADPVLMKEIVEKMVQSFEGLSIDAIAAIEARGFILGSILAHEIGCPFVPIRKSGKLPYKTISQEYSLEYGSAAVEMHEDGIQKGWNVLVHDDLLATGGTAAAAADLVKKCGGEIAGFSFLINLSFLPGEAYLNKSFGKKTYSLISYS